MKLERKHLISVMKHMMDLGKHHEDEKEKNDALEFGITGWSDYCQGYATAMKASIGFIEAILTHTEDEE